LNFGLSPDFSVQLKVSLSVKVTHCPAQLMLFLFRIESNGGRLFDISLTQLRLSLIILITTLKQWKWCGRGSGRWVCTWIQV